jgi:hypothetical protein
VKKKRREGKSNMIDVSVKEEDLEEKKCNDIYTTYQIFIFTFLDLIRMT